MPKPQDDEFGPVDITNLEPDMIPQSVCRWEYIGNGKHEGACHTEVYVASKHLPPDWKWCPHCRKPIEAVEVDSDVLVALPGFTTTEIAQKGRDWVKDAFNPDEPQSVESPEEEIDGI